MNTTRFAAFVWLAGTLGAWAATLPAGTQLEIRLKTKVASNTSRAKDPVEAVLVRPVVTAEGFALPAGTAVRGAVAEAVPVQKPEDRAALKLEFTSLTPPSGSPLEIAAKVIEVDNARESVTDLGRISGILASETLAARINQGVGKVSEKHSGFGSFLETVTSAVITNPDTEVTYAPGVELTLELLKPLQCPVSAAPSAPGPVTPEETLYELVNTQTIQTTTEGKNVPSDLTNLMFIGTQAELEAAFEAAGWTNAAKLNTASGLGVFRAVAGMQGYKEAPMSILLLDGNKPDLMLQKQNNTFEKRHHLRVWKRTAAFGSRPVWLCAATHDIGIEFSPEHRTFIHKIDPQIDRERAKVVSDLVFGGHVNALSLVARPSAPKQSQNATGDKLITDGAMAVLDLK